MRNKLIFLIIGLLATLSAFAQDRIYIATDRNAYLAGDLVYCSLFCADMSGERQDFSAVSYLELISGDGTAAEAKIGLFNGRGAGSFRIPASTPTGNYKLIAYTARNQAVEEGSRILSVFNASSTARVKDGVQIVPAGQYRSPEAPADAYTGNISLFLPDKLSQNQKTSLIIRAPGANVSVSVFHDDALAPADGKTLPAFMKGKAAARGARSGEYEGEIIRADVEGLKESGSHNSDQITAFISTAGDPGNVYIGRSNDDGSILFFTDNIYGDRELVCEVSSMLGQKCHINLNSPFTHPEAGELPALQLSPGQGQALLDRKAALLAQDKVPMDTLMEYIPKRESQLLSGAPTLRYQLDDYTRFPTVREICIEFIPELQFVKIDKSWRIRMFVTDGASARKYLQDNILVLMDGVVLTDHGLLESFDAMLLEDIDIYRQAIAMGGVSYNGVVNFVSKKNYVTALNFPENVRVVDFKGVAYPVAYSGAIPGGMDRDLRQVLYWHPALEIPKDGQCEIPLQMPAYPGKFRVVVEGWTPSGEAIRAQKVFELE